MNRGALAIPNKAPRSRLPLLRGDLPFMEPGGRLTITAGAAVLTAASTTGQSTVYWSPDKHGRAPYREGDRWLYEDLEDEISQALADTEFSPAAAGNNSLYDYWLWRHPTIRYNNRRHKWFCTRGPAWTDGTNRSAGTALARFKGVRVNSVDIVNGPKAGHGLYVGTVGTDGSGTLNMMFNPDAAAGGSNNRLDVWNLWNQVELSALVRDATNTVASASTTWRSFMNSASNRVTFVRGLADGAVKARATAILSNVNTQEMRVGIGLDATNALSGISGRLDSSASGTNIEQLVAEYFANIAAGSHFLQMLDGADGTSGTFIGDNNTPTTEQSGMTVTYWG